MKGVRAFLRTAGKVLAGVVVLVAFGYAAVLAVNRDDRPPSSEARALAAVLESLPEVADAENAYVYLLGFASPRDADPRLIGAERADWIRRLRTDYSLGRDSDPHPPSFGTAWTAQPDDSFRNCPSAREEQECFARLNAAGSAVDAWLAEQQWVLARYETLLGHSSWREIETGDHRGTTANLAAASAARKAWFLEAWARARRGDAERVREMLGADLEFWRLTLTEAGTMVAKLTAVSMVAAHFELASIILKRLPAESVARAVPQSWRDPISAEERSLRRAFAFELQFIRRSLEDVRSPTNRYASWAGVSPEPTGLAERLGDRLASPLLQPQDYVNKVATELTSVAEAVEASYAAIPNEIDAARSLSTGDAAHWAEPLYNVIGDLMLSTDSQDVYADWAARVADLEGVRRAALLTAELRSRGVARSNVAAALEEAVSTNPYTGQPFAWQADSGEIVFQGIRRRDGGRYGFWY